MERFHGWDRRPQCNTMHTHNAMQRARSGLDSPHMRVPFIKSERASSPSQDGESWLQSGGAALKSGLLLAATAALGCVCVFRSGVPVLKAPCVRSTWEAREPRSAPGCVRSAVLLTDIPPFERLHSGFIQLLLVCFWVHFTEWKKTNAQLALCSSDLKRPQRKPVFRSSAPQCFDPYQF